MLDLGNNVFTKEMLLIACSWMNTNTGRSTGYVEGDANITSRSFFVANQDADVPLQRPKLDSGWMSTERRSGAGFSTTLSRDPRNTPPLDAYYKLITKTTAPYPFIEGKGSGNNYTGCGKRGICAVTFDRSILPHSATSKTRLTSLTWLPARSSSTGIRSRSSLS